jgi:CDP-4-dehydro-6-deoxyglucose reductase, E1
MSTSSAVPDAIRVYYAEAVYGREEIDAVLNVLENQRHALMGGANVRDFENRVAALFDKAHGIMVNSGSSANLLALAALDLPAGSEVITPSLTFSTTVAPIVQLGLVPAFVDVEADTYVADPIQIEEMVTPRTSAVMVPNLIGNLARWDAIREIADRRGLVVVEDSADTIGSLYRGTPTGRLSDLSTTSFYASHIVTGAGFGGMLCTSDERVAERARLLRGWGRSSSTIGETEDPDQRFAVSVDGIPYDSKFMFTALGYNFLPSEISAAFGLVQLDRLASNTSTRQENFSALHDFFAGFDGWIGLPSQTPDTTTPWLAFPFVIEDSAPFTRPDLQRHFEADGIQTRTVFTGNILRQPGFAGIERRERAGGYPEANRVMRGGMLIGCHHGLGPEQIDHIKASFTRFAEPHRS